MRIRKALLIIPLIVNFVITACVYVVLPPGLDLGSASKSGDWDAVVTGVSQTTAGDLHVDITIRNGTGSWSTMKAVEGKPAILTTSDGKTHNCETVFVGTGGHRLAPGFQIRGYTGGTKSKPETQLLYVECAGVNAESAAKLAVEYLSFSGDLDYYHQDEGASTGTLKVELGEIEENLSYPIFDQDIVDQLITPYDTSIPALSDNAIRLISLQRNDEGFEFTWENNNPTEFPLKIHIGNPPVIGSDGIIYGYYQIMDLATTPLTPSGGKVEWSTKTAVPPDVSNCFILMSVESKNMRLYVNTLLDIRDK